jgi:outer membrane protein assembly factor BamB
MKNASLRTFVLAGAALLLAAGCVRAQDWPQWRGPNRDNKVTGFTEPKAWPKDLTKKWSVKVGLADASPVLVGDKLYVFARDGGDEVIQCLDAAKGTEVWKEKYATAAASVPMGGHTGPRSAPVVADGKVCTFGVNGVLTCWDAAKGTKLWQKDTKGKPQFFTATSPIVADGKCIVYIGGGGRPPTKGEIVAYDLASGEEKWKWSGEGPAYGSPVLMTVDGTKMIVTLSESRLIAVGLDGKLLWNAAYGSNYSSGTPVIDGQFVICSGPPARMGGGGKGGTVAFKVEKKDDAFAAKEEWKESKSAATYNTPVLKDGALYGIEAAGGGRDQKFHFFCMDAKSGKELWTDKADRGECGAVLDAGAILIALTSDGYLVVFKPNKKEYEEVAKYKVSDKTGKDGVWAYPIIAGNRVYVKDNDSLTLWTIE